jgi:hypothetical protein
MSQQPLVGQGLLNIEASRSPSRHIIFSRAPLDEWSAHRSESTQHSQETDIFVRGEGGIRTRNPHKRSKTHTFDHAIRNNEIASVCCRLLPVKTTSTKETETFDSNTDVDYIRLSWVSSAVPLSFLLNAVPGFHVVNLLNMWTLQIWVSSFFHTLGNDLLTFAETRRFGYRRCVKHAIIAYYYSKSRSRWPRGLRCGSAPARLLGLLVRIPLGA